MTWVAVAAFWFNCRRKIRINYYAEPFVSPSVTLRSSRNHHFAHNHQSNSYTCLNRHSRHQILVNPKIMPKELAEHACSADRAKLNVHCAYICPIVRTASNQRPTLWTKAVAAEHHTSLTKSTRIRSSKHDGCELISFLLPGMATMASHHA